MFLFVVLSKQLKFLLHTLFLSPLVVAGLVANNVWTNPYFGRNLENISASSSQFDDPWWFRADDFIVPRLSDTLGDPANNLSQATRIVITGLSYRGELWCNGQKVADSLVGTFRWFDLDISRYVIPGAMAAIAVKIERPYDRSHPVPNTDTDLAISFIDWAPDITTLDGGMGLWQEVRLEVTGPVSIAHPAVVTEVLASSLSSATLSVMVEVSSHSKNFEVGTMHVSIPGLVSAISAVVSLQPYQTKHVFMNFSKYPVLQVNNPRLWWPWQMGTPYLYDLSVDFSMRHDFSSVCAYSSVG